MQLALHHLCYRHDHADRFFLFPLVPGPPQSLTIIDVTSDSVSLSWQSPVHLPGLLQGFNVEIKQLARNCEQKQPLESCVESELVEWVEGQTSGVTLSPLLKYREYRMRVVAFTRAGAGKPSEWIHTQTLAGSMLHLCAYRLSHKKTESQMFSPQMFPLDDNMRI